ncbi:hypothetical protein QBC40DRAFT_218214 [Triangularia verruculosa]|uniref:Lysyl-tRNA synthetase n=1 Tax=Triangularia verruculosa TaxID=2587418 RepID=A0AAN6XP90_9PEZI|nr:hypothetical protein QBC40DRAFT_218214 [Triangularia verruculosa]
MRPPPSLQFLRPYARVPVAFQLLRRAQLSQRCSFHLARQQELEQAGALKYPRIQNDGGVIMRIPDFRSKYRGIEQGTVTEEEVTLRGRVESVRRAGSKLVFIDIRSEFENVQGLCNLVKLVDGTTGVGLKDLARLLNRGDIISVTGKATRTQTGELSIQAIRLPQVLAPSIVPRPEKVEDTLHRHIDMLAHRRTVDTLRLRSYIIRYLRDFFHQRNFLEFQTPILSGNAGGAVARPFTVHAEAVSKDVSLRIAPELWLKRLVVGGVDRVFELGPAFRNEGIDQTHNPEFTICEFYHAYANLQDLITTTQDLIRGVAEHCSELISNGTLSSLPEVSDLSVYQQPFQQAEFIPTLEAKLGFVLPDLTSRTAHQDLVSLLDQHSIPRFDGQDALPLPKLLDKLAERYIEPLSLASPLFITHHPVIMSPLSKSFLCPSTKQHVSARTELFIRGKELANMYEEENDPFAQREKFAEQIKQKDVEEGQKVEVDESFCYALASGLPPTGGWGCGVERLVMLMAGTGRISEVLSFGNLRNVVVGGSNVAVTGMEGKGEGDLVTQEEKKE